MMEAAIDKVRGPTRALALSVRMADGPVIGHRPRRKGFNATGVEASRAGALGGQGIQRGREKGRLHSGVGQWSCDEHARAPAESADERLRARGDEPCTDHEMQAGGCSTRKCTKDVCP